MSTKAPVVRSDEAWEAPIWKRIVLLSSPLLVIASGHRVAIWSVPRVGTWSWVPLQVTYWLLLGIICWGSGQLRTIRSAYSRPTTWGWWVVNILVGLIPLPILLRNTSLLRMHSLVTYWVVIALLNPFLEEAYWRGLLGSLTARWSSGISLAYTSLFFALAHPLLWGVFSIGNHSWQTVAALLVMGVVWGTTFRRTKSLQAVTLSHFLVDIGNMSVWVFMNLYVPPK
jgi:membrane protease YdiL (CAAX protease family)